MNICGLSRLHCRRCGEETLHRGSNCIHCGTVYEVAIPPSVKLSAKEVMALETAVRKGRKRRSA